MTLNFVHHDNNDTTTTAMEKEDIIKIKPIMHTYVESNEYVDEKLLDFWMTSWKDAGWEIRILLPRDARNHSDYREFNQLLLRKRVCCLPRQTYLRHLAMSTVKEGGFYSELYVLPLRTDIFPEIDEGLLPNEGRFTSWD